MVGAERPGRHPPLDTAAAAQIALVEENINVPRCEPVSIRALELNWSVDRDRLVLHIIVALARRNDSTAALHLEAGLQFAELHHGIS